jgi:branched-chain amino acid transport system substrate-binding protein
MRIKALIVLAGLVITTGVAQADTSVKIGVLNDQSGAYADLSGMGSVVAAQMAAEDFKKAHKGIEVDVIAADHQNKADIAANTSRQWIDQDNVDVIADVPNSAAALAVNAIVREKNRIHLNSGAGTADLTGEACTANTVHWTYDTWALAHGTAAALTKQGGNSWFFLAADYTFGRAMERDAKAVIESLGGEVLGSVFHPLSSGDFSSFLLQAQASGAKVVGLANGGADLTNSIKQAAEFGLVQGGQTLAGLVVFISDIHALGLEAAQGLVLTEAFYWDQNDATRTFSNRFAERFGGKMPTMVHAGVYSSVMHYLKAVEAVGSKDAAKVMAKMKETPVEDPLFGKGEVRQDGRVIHDMYLFRVKSPEQSKGDWDLYETLATIPAAEAFRPLKDGGCPLVQ